jgi:hypothetical protein
MREQKLSTFNLTELAAEWHFPRRPLFPYNLCYITVFAKTGYRRNDSFKTLQTKMGPSILDLVFSLPC